MIVSLLAVQSLKQSDYSNEMTHIILSQQNWIINNIFVYVAFILKLDLSYCQRERERER